MSSGSRMLPYELAKPQNCLDRGQGLGYDVRIVRSIVRILRTILALYGMKKWP